MCELQCVAARASAGDAAAAEEFLNSADPTTARAHLCSPLPTDTLEAFGRHFAAIAALPGFSDWPDLSSESLQTLLRGWLASPSGSGAGAAVEIAVARLCIRRYPDDHSFDSVISFLDFALLLRDPLQSLAAFALPPHCVPRAMLPRSATSGRRPTRRPRRPLRAPPTASRSWSWS
jgi:hypothetical protein